ncbi:hypothetical protein AAMO2058_001644000 [Amorphochlora amoebiformis]
MPSFSGGKEGLSCCSILTIALGVGGGTVGLFGLLGVNISMLLVVPILFLSILAYKMITSRVHVSPNLPSQWKPSKPQEKYLTTRDGLKIKYYIVPGKGFGYRRGKTILFACPLGHCGFRIYYPIMAKYGEDYTYITWDYRGLFSSDAPQRLRRISIPMHAEDGAEVLKSACPHRPQADVLIGHSMGVQVSLEMVLIYPEMIDSLILLNGAHGHVFSTAFQPFFRIPFMRHIPSLIISSLLDAPHFLETAGRLLKPMTDMALLFFGRSQLASPLLKKLLGESYLLDFYEDYMGSVCNDLKTLTNYIRLFQELDAHSVCHLLSSVEHPTLIIVGLFDFLLPAYHGDEMKAEMKNSVLVSDIYSTHASILENPERVMVEIENFLVEAARFKRKTSTIFRDISVSEEKNPNMDCKDPIEAEPPECSKKCAE